MQIDPVFEKSFAAIYGKPCWQVTPGVGTFLTLNFGEPHLEIVEPKFVKSDSEKAKQQFASRQVLIKGQWRLWINCCAWKVLSNGKLIGESSTKASIQGSASFLNGQKLLGFSITPGLWQCNFEFDLGGTLETRPYDHDGIQWYLFDSAALKVLALRSDGCHYYDNFDDVSHNLKPVEVPEPGGG
jgi:hypothetical protein